MAYTLPVAHHNPLVSRFHGKFNETKERYVFNKRKQKAEETVEDFIAALRTLASTCNFCDCLKDSLLRDRIVSGIKDSSTRKRLLKENDLNLETCIAMCCAAESTSPSQPVKTVTWTEDTTAVQAGSVSCGDQRPAKKRDFSLSFRDCDQSGSPDEDEMPEINFNRKQEPAWSSEEDSPDQPSAVYSIAQPMPDNTSGSLLSLSASHACYLCFTSFVLVSSLELHLASVHGEKLHMVFPESSTPDRCDAGNSTNTGVNKEVGSHSKKKTKRKKKLIKNVGKPEKNKSIRHVCDICSKSFSYAHVLKKHLLIHTGLKPFSCNTCGKSFSQAFNLKVHKLTHTNHKPFLCDVCSKSFTQASNLKTHKLTHTGLKPFACDMCDKSFSRLGNLDKHKRTHTGEKPYKCPHCDSAFSQSGHLQHHVRSVHEGAKPHLCDVCGAAFAEKSHLTVHRRSHTGEKPYVCPVCTRGFTTSGALAMHRLTHTGDKPYMCPDCGKCFGQSSNLSQHRLTHTGQKPHSCPHCSVAFRWSKQLKKHMKKEHQAFSDDG